VKDLSRRELVILAPMVALMIWVGAYPAPLLRRMEPSVQAVLERVATRGPGLGSTELGTGVDAGGAVAAGETSERSGTSSTRPASRLATAGFGDAPEGWPSDRTVSVQD
jgi:hypothetical protein